MRKFWWVLGVVILIQCSDDESKKEVSCRLIRQKYAELTYDNNNRVVTITQLDENNGPPSYGIARELEYDESGRLSAIDQYIQDELVHQFVFEYSEGQIIQTEYFDDDPEVDYKITYTLNSNNKVVQLFHEKESDPSVTVTYEYENGNVVKFTRISEGVTTHVSEFDYDDHPNPKAQTGFELYLQDDIFHYGTQSKNNIAKVTSTPTGSSPIVSTFTYTYNSNGYPTEQFLNGSPTAGWFFEYQCE